MDQFSQAKANVKYLKNCVRALSDASKTFSSYDLNKFRKIVKLEGAYSQYDRNISISHSEHRASSGKIKEMRHLKSIIRSGLFQVKLDKLTELRDLEIQTRDIWSLAHL